jgi:hypothetical protein
MKKMIFSILLINGLLAYGQTAVKDVYEFPLKPGSKQWIQLSIKERKDALQIPERVLTKYLPKVCWNPASGSPIWATCFWATIISMDLNG